MHALVYWSQSPGRVAGDDDNDYADYYDDYTDDYASGDDYADYDDDEHGQGRSK